MQGPMVSSYQLILFDDTTCTCCHGNCKHLLETDRSEQHTIFQQNNIHIRTRQSFSGQDIRKGSSLEFPNADTLAFIYLY